MANRGVGGSKEDISLVSNLTDCGLTFPPHLRTGF